MIVKLREYPVTASFGLSATHRNIIAAKLLILGSALILLAGPSTVASDQILLLKPDSLAIEFPTLGTALHPPGVLHIPEPQRVQQLIIHIPLPRIHKVRGKLNTIASGPVHNLRQRRDETLYSIDLRQNRSDLYSLNTESNTIEIEVFPTTGAEPIYARWVIASPKDPHGWQRHEASVEGTENEPSAGARLAPDGMQVLEELSDGRRLPLEFGLTTSSKVIVKAAFSEAQASVGLRIQWSAGGDRSRTLSSGAPATGEDRGIRPHAPAAHTLEVPVELDLGTNHLQVEVIYGDIVLYRSQFEVLRQRPSIPGDVDGDRWAVLIGISKYQDPAAGDLSYAHRDAQAMRDMLVEKGRFDPDRVRLLVDDQATQAEIRSALFTFLTQTAPEDLVLIFLAGHGVFDTSDPDNFYFLASDSMTNSLGGTAVPMWDIGTAMGHTIRARQIVVLADTCHSGGALSYGNIDGSGLNFVNKYLETMAARKGRLIFTASQAHEVSIEKDGLEHGAFTYHALVGLRGAADTDRDRTVTLDELIQYVKKAVPNETQGQQHPSFRALGFDTNLALTFNTGDDGKTPRLNAVE